MSTPGAMRTVVVQDRSRLYRESLQLLLQATSGVEEARVAADPDALVEACRSCPPDAVLFEVGGVPWDVDDVARRLRLHADRAVLVGTFPPDHRRHRAVAGVPLVSRTSSCRVLVAALCGTAVADGVQPVEREDRRSEVPDSLTQREFQILALISGGLTTAQIAARIGISPKTVENRRQTLFVKLGVQSQSHAIAVAMRTGLLGSGAPGPDVR
jgi:DNA-binding NarL/FixJ family response regulator